MNRISSAAAGLLCLALSPLLLSCKQEQSPPKASPTAPNRQPLTPVAVTTGPDGLAYLPPSTTPFTGDAISPHPDAPWLVKLREPYLLGKRHGDKVELFKNGGTKTLRRYQNGVPQYAASYHKNGQLKFELNLNAQDKGEGPYKRWYADGRLESTAGLDAEERWHGELKEWDPAGNLKSHHILDHGLLKEIIFESPESRAARQATGLELPRAAPSPPSPPAAPPTSAPSPP